MAPEKETPNLEAEVARLQSRVGSLGESVNRNTDATTALRGDVARLRGELNGTLPRIDRNVDALSRQVTEYAGSVHEYKERTQVHEHEIGTILGALSEKADKPANDEAHKRLWFVIKVSLVAIATGTVALLIAKAIGL